MTRFGLVKWHRHGVIGANLAGSFLLGLLWSTDPGSDLVLVVGTGFCGSLTTFSSFGLDASVGTPARRLLVVVGTTVGCLAAVSIGYAIG
ncbi:MAG: CrcB family protein [Ilumatobacter sp.]|nr:CrcB family protein [Ilumatobacter sp.]